MKIETLKNYHNPVARIKEGERFIVQHMMSERVLENCDKVDNRIFVAKCELLVRADDHVGNNVFKHVRDGIPVVQGKRISTNSTNWSKLRKVCKKNNVPKVRVFGGGAPLCYTTQIAVEDFYESGSQFFIVDRYKIDSMLGK